MKEFSKTTATTEICKLPVIEYDMDDRIKDTAYVLRDIFNAGSIGEADDVSFVDSNFESKGFIFSMLGEKNIRTSFLWDSRNVGNFWFCAGDVGIALGLTPDRAFQDIIESVGVDELKVIEFGFDKEPLEFISPSGFFTVLLKYADNTETGHRFMRWLTRTLLPTLFDGSSYDMESAYFACDEVYPEIANG